MEYSAQQIHDKLINEYEIRSKSGQISFGFGDFPVNVKKSDVVGNVIQEWMHNWLEHYEVDFAPSQNTQMPPDFYLSPGDRTVGLLEVKAFNATRGPGFDIADFNMYVAEITENPCILDADYLVFAYKMIDGEVSVENLWCKKVWQITCSSADWPVKLQVKRKVVHKIRPGTFYSQRSKYKPFRSLEDFISAIEQTVYQNEDTRPQSNQWQNRFLSSYQAHYGVRLQIPRWSEIEDTYR